MFRWGGALWPAVYVGAFLVNLAIGSSWPLAAAIAVGETLRPRACAVWLKGIGLHSPAGYVRRNPGSFIAPNWSLAVLAIVVWLGGYAVAWAQQDPSKPLIVGSEEDYPPFAIGRTDETAGGFTVDLWKAVAAESGLNYTIRVRPFRQLLEEFKAGKIDVMINLAQSAERRAFADFSVPHVIVNGAVFVRNDESRIRSEADFAGKSIIVLNGDLAHDYAVSKGWQQQLVLVDTAAHGLQLLASGRHDAMLLSKLAGMQTLLELKIRNLKALDAKADFAQRFSFAVHKGSTDLLAKINEGLALSKSAGTYDALYEKWFGVFEEREVSFRQMLKYLGPIALAVLVFAGFLLVRQHERRKSVEALRHQTALLEAQANASIDGILVVDRQGRKIFQNHRVAELWKIPRHIAEDSDDAVLDRHLMNSVRHPAQFVERVTYLDSHPAETSRDEVELVDGTFLDRYSAPVLGKQGEIYGRIWTFRDITRRRRAEEQLQVKNTVLEGVTRVQRQFLIETNSRQMFDQMLVLLLEITASDYGFIAEARREPGGQSYLRSLAISNIAWNDETRALYDNSKLTGIEFHNLNNLFGAVVTSRETVIANDPAHDLRRGGSPPGHPPLSAFLGMPFFHGDDLTGMVGLANRAGGYDEALVQNLTPMLATCSSLVLAYTLEHKRRLGEEKLRGALAEKEVLLKEIYHRVKNNLQVVSSLLNLQSRRVTDTQTRQLLDDSANRVKSMALVHEQLYRAENLSSIRLAEYLKQLTNNLTNTNQPLSTRVPLRLEAEELTAGVESAIPLGLLVNELVSNAYRHGYEADAPGGEILVRLTGLPEGWLCLEVKDDGSGLPADFAPGEGTSLGMQLVVTLAQQLGAELTWNAGHPGACFTLRFKRETPTTGRVVT
jgi:two-component sensor histidine kinase/ABC-type amino acid transport substrate-binding protein